MGIIDRFTGAQFKKNVQAAAADGISQQEFTALKKEFDGLWGLAKYAVSSWVASEHPGLEGALRMKGDAAEGWNAYKAADGHVQE